MDTEEVQEISDAAIARIAYAVRLNALYDAEIRAWKKLYVKAYFLAVAGWVVAGLIAFAWMVLG